MCELIRGDEKCANAMVLSIKIAVNMCESVEHTERMDCTVIYIKHDAEYRTLTSRHYERNQTR